MKLTVLKTLRLAPPDVDTMPADTLAKIPTSMMGAIYLEGHVVEPSAREAAFLVATFPAHFDVPK